MRHQIRQFYDRTQAGQILADRLAAYSHRADVLVLGLPRGGVPVAYQIASLLKAPLDVLVVRKLGLPGQEELAIGAIAAGGVRVLNEELVAGLHLGDEIIERVARHEEQELARREQRYRGNRPAPLIKGKTIILVDDGLATGTTMRAALAVLKKASPARLVIAVPVAPHETIREFETLVDEMVCVLTPDPFYALGLWYKNFNQVADEEVCRLLAASASNYHLSGLLVREAASKRKEEVKLMKGDKAITQEQKQAANTIENPPEKRESGLPGGDQGRKDEIGHTGVYPLSAGLAPAHAVTRTPAGWGQGERGAEGNFDHGESGLSYIPSLSEPGSEDLDETTTTDKRSSVS